MAVIDTYCSKAIELAKELNPSIEISNGINWIWAIGFKTIEDAKTFDSFCCNNGCETRGVYDGRSDEDTFDVRFR